jgi:hypothetical protein
MDRVDFTIGDVLKALPYGDNTFDLVHMRFFTGALKVSWIVLLIMLMGGGRVVGCHPRIVPYHQAGRLGSDD